MIKVNRLVSLNQNEFKFSFIRSSGPGGQNVNKVATAVQLKFDVVNSEFIPEYLKEIILENVKKKSVSKGVILIEAKRYRTQEKNKEDAIKRLVSLIKEAVKVKKKRINTRPTKVSSEKRIKTKKIKSSQKKLRSKVNMQIDS